MVRHLFVLGIGLGLALSAGCTRQGGNSSTGGEGSPSASNTGTPGAGRMDDNDRQNLNDTVDENRRTGALNTNERQPVAGREAVLENELKNKLGNDWTVSMQGENMVATRAKMNPPGNKLAKNVQDTIKSVHNHDKGLTAMYEGGDSVTVRGTSKDCGDAASQVKNFADIDGINRITVGITCQPKQ